MSNTMTLNLETVEGSGLRFRGRAGSGTEMVTDSGPGMVAPSPIEALLLALGGCEGMDVISILRKKRQAVTAYEVAVSGERQTEHPRRYTKIEIVHRFTGRDLNPAAIDEAIRLSATKYCSVHASLANDIEIVNRFEIQPESIGARDDRAVNP
jgi:putative redox protein